MTDRAVAVVIPTIDFDAGAEALRACRATAGIPTAGVVACDYARRGSTVCGNAAEGAGMALGLPYLCYCNDDIKPTQEGWLARLVEAVETDPKIGVAVPGLNCRTNPQAKAKPGMPPGIEDVKEASFAVALFRREALEDVGVFFDTAFIHYGNDSDLLRRLHAKGWRSVWVRDVYVEHHLMDGYIEEWRGRDKAAFKVRWG
ncbi:unnamed protein product [marine sediment metagenome]|uniref:Glycosyltransferase 2-like domain-containing protein n=1 Tax=marine sediment metagenome TaxID=412755 RepID=X0RZC1_9ZZZZ